MSRPDTKYDKSKIVLSTLKGRRWRVIGDRLANDARVETKPCFAFITSVYMWNKYVLNRVFVQIYKMEYMNCAAVLTTTQQWVATLRPIERWRYTAT